MKGIIVSAVFKFIADATADLDAKLGCDCDIAFIKETMDVASEQKAVIDRVRSGISVWLDVGGFERRQSMFLRNGAGSPVGVGYQYPEGTLPEARLDRCFLPITGPLLLDAMRLLRQIESRFLLPGALDAVP